jgi:hypothetical protein
MPDLNRATIDRIASAVLYEGYILYPYRPSLKNRQRWTFGGLYPRQYAEHNSERWICRCECVIRGNEKTRIATVARFLHLIDRRVSESAGAANSFREVPELRLGDRVIVPWQEAEEREFATGEIEIAQLLDGPWRRSFTFCGRRWSEPVHGTDGAIAGQIERHQQEITGTLELKARREEPGVFVLTALLSNATATGGERNADRESASLHALVSAHLLLGVSGGKLVSAIDPPAEVSAAVADCVNEGLWPVLVGDESKRNTLLASPIILYDFPQVAPESPGDLFDGAEIDEILTMRILTLTDDEKRQAAAIDDRAGALLRRTEGLTQDQLLALHGTMRNLRPTPEPAHG